MSGAIAIFAKTPGMSAAKTRLAAGIGDAAAAEFYGLSLDAVEETVGRFLKPRQDWIARWAVAEENGDKDARWQRFGARYTGPGGLGERMWRIYEGLRRVHGRVFLIGSDAPQMTIAHLRAAQDALETSDFVFGPAQDGGFWLFGGKRMVPKDVWLAPEYSTKTALSELERAMLDAGLPQPARLDTLCDVDDMEDLDIVLQQMPKDRSLCQRKMHGWLKRQKRLVTA